MNAFEIIKEDSGNAYVNINDVRITVVKKCHGVEGTPGIRIQTYQKNGTTPNMGPEFPIDGNKAVEFLAALTYLIAHME